jgi:hypothetical protein
LLRNSTITRKERAGKQAVAGPHAPDVPCHALPKNALKDYGERVDTLSPFGQEAPLKRWVDMVTACRHQRRYAAVAPESGRGRHAVSEREPGPALDSVPC